MLSERTTAAMAVAVYFGYYVMPTPDSRGWAFYAATGALVVRLGLHLRQEARTGYGLFAAALLVSEGLQQAGCGLATWGITPDGQDLCKLALGADLYAVLASMAGALLVMMLWQRRK